MPPDSGLRVAASGSIGWPLEASCTSGRAAGSGVAAAAIAVPSELGEDEILVAVVRRPHSTLEARDIRNWCAEQLNASKWPRYVAFLENLPYTPSHRVAKHQLRSNPALREMAIDLEAPNKETVAG